MSIQYALLPGNATHKGEVKEAEDFALRMSQYRARIARQIDTGEATWAEYEQARRVEDRAHRAAEAHNRGRYNL